MNDALSEVGFRGPSTFVVEAALYFACFLLCLYWARGLFLAREGVRHWLARLISAAATVYLLFVGLWLLSKLMNNSIESHIAFAIGAAFLIGAVIYARRKPRPRRRAIPKRIRTTVIARDLGTVPFDASKHHIDHIWPFSKGGSHSSENLRVIGKKANLKKGARRPRLREMW